MRQSIVIKSTLTLLATLFIWATSVHAKSQKVEDYIRQYYTIINQAELAIVDSNFKQAINLYNEAFKLKRPNTLDLHNAYCATAQINDCMNGRIYLEKLANLGYRIPKTILNNSDFWDCTANGLVEISDMVRKDFFESPIGRQLDSLEKEDQSTRMTEKTNYEQMAKVDSAVQLALFKLLSTEKFTNVEPGVSYGNPGNEYSVIWLSRWHHRGRPSILDSILLANVMKGDYDPAVYASLTSLENNAKYGIYYNEYRKWTAKERKAINQNRTKIYLEPLEDYEKKIAMQLKTDALIKMEGLMYGDEALWNTIYFILTPSVYQAPVQ